MSEEIDNLIDEYRELQAKKEQQTILKDTDPLLTQFTQELQKLQGAIEERNNDFGIAEITDKQNGIKEQIREKWEDPAKKSYKSTFGTATLKTTKSLVVDSAKAVLEFLVKNDQCEKGAVKFNLSVLRKFADAGVLNKGATHYIEKQSVSIKLK